MLKEPVGRCRCPEALHTDEEALFTQPAFPAKATGGLAGNPVGDGSWQHLLAVAGVLGGEEILAGQADHPGPDTRCFQHLGGGGIKCSQT